MIMKKFTFISKIVYKSLLFFIAVFQLAVLQNLFSQEQENEIDSLIYKRTEYFKRKITDQDSVPQGLLQRGYEQRAELQKIVDEQNKQSKSGQEKNRNKFLSLGKWESIGPSNVGGRIRCIVSAPNDNTIIFIAAASGGIWKSVDGAVSFKPVFDNYNSIAFGVVVFDPNNPNIMYAGTGEEAGSNGYSGAGIFKSTDMGETWRYLNLKEVFAITKIFVSKKNSNLIYATGIGSGGFFRSEDGGQNFQKVLSEDLFDMAVNPANPDEVYVSSSIIKGSVDGGKTFTQKSSGFSSNSRVSIALAESQPNILYALGSQNGNGVVYKTTNKANSWSLLKTFEPAFFNNQQFYNICVAVSPVNPDLVLIGGIDIWKSKNGGASWVNISNAYSGGNPLVNLSIHPDQHWVSFDNSSPEIVFLGNDGGSYFSVDNADNWQTLATTLPVSQFYRMDIDQTNPYRVFGGTQDNGSHGMAETQGISQRWRNVGGGDGFYCAVLKDDPKYVLTEVYNGGNTIKINPLQPDTDWEAMGDPEDKGLWATPLAVSPADNATVFTGRSALYKTLGPKNWKKVGDKYSDKISCIGLSMHSIDELIVGTPSGVVKFSVDSGKTWTSSKGISGYMNDFKYDPVVKGRVYGVSGGSGTKHVFVSNDFGANFTNITGNLPRISVNAIEIDPNNNQHLFIGSDVGVFVSIDAGSTWQPFVNGLPNAPVTDLRIHKATKYIYCSTYGRSMWRAPISDENLPINSAEEINFNKEFEIKNISPNIVSKDFQIEYSCNTSNNLRLELRNASGKLVLQKILELNEIGINKRNLRVLEMPSGEYFMTLTDNKKISKPLRLIIQK